MITAETYATERALVDKAEATVRALWPAWERGGFVPESVTAHPDYRAVDNGMRGRVAQYETLTNPPARLVAYVGKPIARTDSAFGLGHRDLTTWTGDAIGTCHLGMGWKVQSWIGSRMYQVNARIAGHEYTGRGFGEGMSVVLRETAASKRKHGRA
jgi:hypothetical protein